MTFGNRPGTIPPMIAPRQSDDPHRTWTVADLLGWTEAHFRKLAFLTPRLDAEVLLAHALGGGRLELYTGYRKVVEPEERARFRALVMRRTKGEPVAYITGQREFHSLRFEVSPAVLIPRPETEHLVDAVVEHLRRLAAPPEPMEPMEPPEPAEVAETAAGPDVGGGGDPAEIPAETPVPEPAPEADPPASGAGPGQGPAPSAWKEVQVLDLGTGSGNIAISVAKEIPSAQVVAVDSSPEALAVARRNAAAHGVVDRIRLLEGDLFRPLGGSDPPPLFDAIASNPPYIPLRDRPGLPVDVRDFEPPAALFDGRSGPGGDGLGFHREIALRAPAFLRAGGLLALEVGAGQAPAVQDLLRAAGLISVRSIQDLGAIQRVVLGEKPGPGPGPA